MYEWNTEVTESSTECRKILWLSDCLKYFGKENAIHVETILMCLESVNLTFLTEIFVFLNEMTQKVASDDSNKVYQWNKSYVVVVRLENDVISF